MIFFVRLEVPRQLRDTVREDSDLHLVLEGWARPGTWQGHEWVGRVAAVGENVTAWRPGDAVVGGPSERCGRCVMCRAGRPAAGLAVAFAMVCSGLLTWLVGERCTVHVGASGVVFGLLGFAKWTGQL